MSACVLTLKTMDTRTILRDRFGFDDFRPAQREVIDLVLGGQSVLSVMPTGSGKSLCFQLPALALPGLTLVVSPLIALMKDQVDHLDKLGIPAESSTARFLATSSTSGSSRLRKGRSSCCTLHRSAFRMKSLGAIRSLKVSLFAVDEAHCVSLWGHRLPARLSAPAAGNSDLGNPPVVALTATATPAVRVDILKQLGIEGAQQVVSGFDRPNLYLEVREVADRFEKVRGDRRSRQMGTDGDHLRRHTSQCRRYPSIASTKRHRRRRVSRGARP